MATDLGIPLVTLGQLPIAVIDREASARLMVEIALGRRGSARQPAVITSANGQVLSMCARDPAVRDLFLSADLIHADGMPLVFASRLKGRTPLPERVATTDLFHDVARLAEASGASFYFLGGTRAVIEKAVHNVRQLYPKLAIAGFRRHQRQTFSVRLTGRA
jgi:UDP-N-acetyl-D-mannosaminuronic acid transferase (WecB/TagA/CpsF family)